MRTSLKTAARNLDSRIPEIQAALNAKQVAKLADDLIERLQRDLQKAKAGHGYPKAVQIEAHIKHARDFKKKVATMAEMLEDMHGIVAVAFD